MTQIDVDVRMDNVTIIMKSDEVYKNIVMTISRDEAFELARKILREVTTGGYIRTP